MTQAFLPDKLDGSVAIWYQSHAELSEDLSLGFNETATGSECSFAYTTLNADKRCGARGILETAAVRSPLDPIAKIPVPNI